MRENRTNQIYRKKNSYVAGKRAAGFKVLVILGILLAIFAGIVLHTKNSSHEDGEVITAEFDRDTKLYTTVSVRANDSLWSITSDYSEKGYDTQREYIDEIKAINGLSGDSIKAGSSLIIAYYDYEYTMSASED